MRNDYLREPWLVVVLKDIAATAVNRNDRAENNTGLQRRTLAG
jgi:hypothetical protein